MNNDFKISNDMPKVNVDDFKRIGEFTIGDYYRTNVVNDFLCSASCIYNTIDWYNKHGNIGLHCVGFTYSSRELYEEWKKLFEAAGAYISEEWDGD